MDWVELNGAGLRYDFRRGSGTPLLLIHEMGGTLESWDLVLPLLGEDRTILRFDFRGAGQSTKIRGIGDIDQMADDAAALLDHCGIAERVVVAGGAVGGAIAIHCAARHTRRVRGLVALGPATGIPAERQQQVLDHADNVERNGMLFAADAELPRSYPEVLRADRGRFERFRARWLANDPSSYAATYRMLAGYDLSDEVAGLAVPSLFLAGHHDPLRPPSMIEPLAATATGSTFRAIESGHFMATQTPEIIADALARFTNAVSA